MSDLSESPPHYKSRARAQRDFRKDRLHATPPGSAIYAVPRIATGRRSKRST